MAVKIMKTCLSHTKVCGLLKVFGMLRNESISDIKKLIIFLLFAAVLLSLARAECTENWQCSDWQRCVDGVSERTCFDFNGCSTADLKPSETANCRDIAQECYDGILNVEETDTDCGGSICKGCDDGKTCFSNSDCKINSCIDQICSYEKVIQPAMQPTRLSWLLAMLIILLSAAIVYLLMLLIKTRGLVFRMLRNVSISDIMKKLKRQRILIPSIKERIKISIPMSKKKSRLDRFADNVNGYLNSMKSEKVTRKDNPKGLLNKNSFKKQEHPVKDFMLDNLKEVYNNE